MSEQSQPPRFLYLKARLVVPFGRRRRAFVKLYDSCRRSTQRRNRRLLERERVCLDVLAGLAVPKLLELPEGALRLHLGFEPTAHVAQGFVVGKPLNKAGLAPGELLAAWLFLVEQLVAFRRHQILYTDLKPSNVLANRRPLKVTSIDFDRAAAATESGVYDASHIGYTAGYQAPEHGRGAWLREASVVFQLGMLLAACWMGLDNSSLRDPEAGLELLCEKVAAEGGAGLAELVRSCLAYAEEERPRGYEEVLERIKRAGENPESRQLVSVWKALRAPYEERLAGVGLAL